MVTIVHIKTSKIGNQLILQVGMAHIFTWKQIDSLPHLEHDGQSNVQLQWIGIGGNVCWQLLVSSEMFWFYSFAL